MKKVLFPVTLLMACMLAGCASTGSVDAVRREADETKTRLFSLEKELATAREDDKNVRSDFAALRKNDAELQANLDSLKSELQNLTGRIEDQGLAIRRPTEELTRYREDTDRRIVALEDRIVKLQVAVDELNKRLKEGAASASAPPVTADALYLKGLDTFKSGDLAGARTHLTRFIEQHPDHDLVANARYWIGETYYGEKSYEQAILEFQEVIKQYPKKEKAPAAMLKQALSFKALKDVKSTQYLLRRLTTDYPKSEEAKRARVLLKEIK